MPRFTTIVIISAILVAGCTIGMEDNKKPEEISKRAVNESTMTEAQALERVEQLIKETVEIITPKPRLDLFRPSLNTQHCLDPTDGGSEERIVVTRIYYLRDIPQDRLSHVAQQVRRY